jgi:dipeptidyl aminopeptidase/acylaminoacyl peptidase
MTASERRLRHELRAARPPRAAEAELRAWQVVRAAHAERVPARRRRPVARLALAAVVALATAAVALTPAGARVGDWISDVVDPPARTSLSSLPADGRLLVLGDGGVWVVGDDGARRLVPGIRDATWSPGGLYLAGARGRELVALDPQGTERWTRPAAARVTMPRWSPDGYRVAYRSGRELRVAVGNNIDDWSLGRTAGTAAPAWKPLAEPAEQVLAFAAGQRVRIVEVDTGRRLGATPVGPPPLEIWWARDGRRLVTVYSSTIAIHGPRGRLLRVVPLPAGLTAGGSAVAPGGLRLAVIARHPGAEGASELLVVRLDRPGRLRRLLSAPGPFAGLTWSIDGSLLVVGRPRADEWLYVRPRASARLQSVEGVRELFDGGTPPRTGAFPLPAGWCYAEPVDRTTSGPPPCS